MERDMLQELGKYMKEMGLEELVSRFRDTFTDSFMIRGEETEELKEALHRASEELISLIWEKIMDEEPAEGMSRQQKEESLYKSIPEYFESRFDLLEISKLDLLMRIMNGAPVDVTEAAEALRKFAPYGWVFSFVKDDMNSLIVMKELQEILKTVQEPEVMERIALLNGIRYIVKTCLELYGVCTLEQICDVLGKETEKEELSEEGLRSMKETIEEYLPYLEEQEVLWLDDEYIISPYLQEKRDYKALLRRQSRNYYVPDSETVRRYGSGDIVVKSKEYETVFTLLVKVTKDVDETEEMLEEVTGYVTREDWGIAEIMNYLYDCDVVFDNNRMMEKLTDALGVWLYTIRRWSECGYSRQELRKENTDLLSIDDIADGKSKTVRETEKKVYPNDLCPCGSGKKYKKCCGRK